MEIRSVRISPEVTLEYAIQDPGGARIPAMVCLHGVTDSWRSYAGVLPFLSAHPVRVIAVSLRGYGHSSQPAAGCRFASLAEDVRLLLDALDLPSAILVGHSMGASVAMQFAASYPDRAAGLVLMGAFASHHALRPRRRGSLPSLGGSRSGSPSALGVCLAVRSCKRNSR